MVLNPKKIGKINQRSGFVTEESKRMEGTDGGFEFPQVIIQHIQSFLDGEAAARTTLVSKSWHTAWSTRPDLDFDQRCFYSDEDTFWEFTNKTMQRYEELNLKIETFKLFISNEELCDYSVVSELIVKAMGMGTKDFNFGIENSPWYKLPREAFGSDKLSTYGCQIDLGEDREEVEFSGLKSLSLIFLPIKNDTLWRIATSCPLIEKFRLEGCRPSTWGVNVLHLHKLCMLKSLFFGDMIVDASFFSDGFDSKFPVLKDLNLYNCEGFEGIKLCICSRSLECIKIRHRHMLRAKFDVPNIRKFIYAGAGLPALSFGTVSGEWASDITIFMPRRRRGAKWFLGLNKLLTRFSSSTITTLSFELFHFGAKAKEELDRLQGLPTTRVENLKISANYSDNCALMYCLLLSCRPYFIILEWFPIPCANHIRMLCNTLVEVVGARGSVQDLEELNVEFFEESGEEWQPLPGEEWQPLPWKTLLQDSSTPERVRFRLI